MVILKHIYMWAVLNRNWVFINMCIFAKIIKEDVLNLKENERMREELDWMWRGRRDMNKLYMLKIIKLILNIKETILECSEKWFIPKRENADI